MNTYNEGRTNSQLKQVMHVFFQLALNIVYGLRSRFEVLLKTIYFRMQDKHERSHTNGEKPSRPGKRAFNE